MGSRWQFAKHGLSHNTTSFLDKRKETTAPRHTIPLFSSSRIPVISYPLLYEHSAIPYRMRWYVSLPSQSYPSQRRKFLRDNYMFQYCHLFSFVFCLSYWISFLHLKKASIPKVVVNNLGKWFITISVIVIVRILVPVCKIVCK